MRDVIIYLLLSIIVLVNAQAEVFQQIALIPAAVGQCELV